MERQRNQFRRVQLTLNKEPEAEAAIDRDGKETQISIVCVTQPRHLATIKHKIELITNVLIEFTYLSDGDCSLAT